jgi:uncharacterized protein
MFPEPAAKEDAIQEPGRPSAGSRISSAIEFILGSAIVIGHNVFKVVPNEVPILALAGLLSARLRNGRFSAIGFKRPESWSRVIQIALAAAALRILLGEFVIDPLTNQFWPPGGAPEGIDEIRGNLKFALLALVIVWGFAAFGEEIAYRGYLLMRAADLGRNTTTSYWIAMILTSILFGIGHYYKGPSGMIDSGIAGLILGTAFLLSDRNLWTSIFAHGFIDTFGLILVYFGLDS